MSKVQVVTVPTRPPGKCVNCGASKEDGRKYVDIGLYLEWYGDVYFCGYCIHEVTKKIGLFSNLETQVAALEQEIVRLETLKSNGERLNDLVIKNAAEIKAHYDKLFSNVISSDSISSPDVGTNEEESSKSGTNSTKQGTNESDSSGRPKNLPSLADLINDL